MPQATSATGSKLGFPSGNKTIQTQAPMYASFLVAGIIIGVLLATAQASYNRDAVPGIDAPTLQQTAAASSAAASGPKTTSTKPPLVLNDQPAGPSVSISGLNLARPTWAVVYVSREGKPGLALGARLFFASDRQGTVGLLRNTQAGQGYFVGLSVDDGDRMFSLTKDKPLADADGGPLWATFRAL